MRRRYGVACYEVHDFSSFIKLWEERFSGVYWMFRGQSSDWPLKTTFERACDEFDIPLPRRDGLERRLIRDFRRKYIGNDRNQLHTDTLYCLATMQHYGSPTRLHDWTYSPFFALYFAMAQRSCSVPVIWCIDQQWLHGESRNVLGDLVNKRANDHTRNEASFMPLFMAGHRIVLAETPMQLHERLIVQQGSFVCPATNRESLMGILESFAGWDDEKNVMILELPSKIELRKTLLACLNRMNINRQSLFPGLDGFAQSLWQRIPFFDQDDLDTI